MQRDVGTVTVNSNEGIFGTVEDAGFISGEAVSVAEPEEVHAGEASILCTISGSDTRAYEVEILRVNPRSRDGRDLLLRVTDPELLETTGGIVQGMSGSPILQDGRLVGAVTPGGGTRLLGVYFAHPGGIRALCEWRPGAWAPGLLRRVYRDFLCKTIDRRGGGAYIVP